jgi:hypothetical protein
MTRTQTLNLTLDTRQHDVDSQHLVQVAEVADIERAIVVKKARRTEATLTKALTVAKDRVNALEDSLGTTLAEKLVMIQERKKGTQTQTVPLTLSLARDLTINLPRTLTLTVEARQYDVDSQRLVQNAQQADIDRTIGDKKARRAEACLTQALSVEKHLVNALQHTLECTLVEKLVIEQDRKKGTLTLSLGRT